MFEFSSEILSTSYWIWLRSEKKRLTNEVGTKLILPQISLITYRRLGQWKIFGTNLLVVIVERVKTSKSWKHDNNSGKEITESVMWKYHKYTFFCPVNFNDDDREKFFVWTFNCSYEIIEISCGKWKLREQSVLLIDAKWWQQIKHRNRTRAGTKKKQGFVACGKE